MKGLHQKKITITNNNIYIYIYIWLQIKVANGENVNDSDEGKIMAVRKWPSPDTVKELRFCMDFVAYMLFYYSKLLIDFNTMTSPLLKCIVDVIK